MVAKSCRKGQISRGSRGLPLTWSPNTSCSSVTSIVGSPGFILCLELFCSMPESTVQQIEADITETERLMTELRLRIAISQSAGEDTTESERRVQQMVKGWMMLQDQRQR